MRWTPQKIAGRLKLIEPLVYRRRIPLPPFRFFLLSGPGDTPPVGLDVNDSAWTEIRPGEFWGERQATFVLRSHFQIPPGWSADGPLALYLPLGQTLDFSHPEALVYLDGVAYSGADQHHREVLLPQSVLDDQPHLLALHGWVGIIETPLPKLLMGECALVQIDPPTRAFVDLAGQALGVANILGENDPARAALYSTLDQAFKLLDLREPLAESFYASLPAALDLLKAGIAAAGAPLPVDVYAVGNAHLDIAWLWTLGQTRRKAAHTFYNVMRLMEQYPAYAFTQSQPQLYEFIRQDDPALFAAIQQRVQEGRWEVTGGMWVEADCNVSGAEPLARQFLLGRSFFREHFGPQAETPILWLPDVFGYSWALPQLIKEAGLRYFFTIKIGWSQYNRLPYDSFWWQGLDGTRVLTHFSPTPEPGSAYASTYNAVATPEQVLGTWTNFRQKDWGVTSPPPAMIAYGYGDGGGGPTRGMLSNLRAFANFPGMPRTRFSRAGDFFSALEREAGERLPTWNGELYLEYHRGTYTSQSRNKRANRKSEFLLHDAEFLAALAATLDERYPYPQAELSKAWHLMCLNQFHDILPGSSIGAVYAESLQQYAEIEGIGHAARDGALAAIAAKLGGDLLVVNPTAFSRNEPAFCPTGTLPGNASTITGADGKPLATQPVDGGLLVDAGELPPFSVTPLFFSQAGPGRLPESTLRASALPSPWLENDSLRVEFNPAGDIIRIYDKANQREVLPPGALANQLQAFEDRPIYWDAWDIDIFYDDKQWLAEPASSITVVEHGPLRAALEIRRKILGSEVLQRVSLSHNSARLDFDTTIQWGERHILLKAAFPVDVLAPQATYEIQWGNVQRPTHRNTSWDWARFETCAQKWVDLSEGDYGVSLLNDCKYGHDIRDNVLRLSLLRSPTSPDPEADQGEQCIAYSLYPHSGGWDERTIAQAYALNDPLIAWKGSGSAGCDPLSLFSVERPNVVIETVKQAEDGRGLVVRLYESQRSRGPFTLRSALPVKAAWRSNLLEEDQEQLECSGNEVQAAIKPYQIMTIRVELSPTLPDTGRE